MPLKYKGIVVVKPEATKWCNRCKIYHPISAFPEHSHHKDGYDSRCKVSKAQDEKDHRRIEKTAPPKPADGRCEITRELIKDGKWVMDVDHALKPAEFRGWGSDGGNTSIAKLGDNGFGLLTALEYFLNRNVVHDPFVMQAAMKRISKDFDDRLVQGNDTFDPKDKTLRRNKSEQEGVRALPRK